jgi:hypothetical protein
LETLVAFVALQALVALETLVAFETLVALDALVAFDALDALVALVALVALQALVTLGARWALKSLGTLQTLIALSARGTLEALVALVASCSLEALVALFPFVAFGALFTLGAGRAGFAAAFLNAQHSLLAGAADHLDAQLAILAFQFFLDEANAALIGTALRDAEVDRGQRAFLSRLGETRNRKQTGEGKTCREGKCKPTNLRQREPWGSHRVNLLNW